MQRHIAARAPPLTLLQIDELLVGCVDGRAPGGTGAGQEKIAHPNSPNRILVTPAGSPLDHAAEQRLLVAARRLFCREGIHATGVSRLLAEAGVARRTLYQRFGSKDKLLEAVFCAEAAMWFGWFDVELPRRADAPRERLLALFDVLSEWFASETFFGCIFLNAVAEHDKETSWVREIAVGHREAIDARLSRLLRAAKVRNVVATTAKVALIIDGAIVAAMVTGDNTAALIARSIAEDVLALNSGTARARSAKPGRAR